VDRRARDGAPPLSYGWAIVATLSVTEIVSWGILYYGFPVLLAPMEQDLGASRVAITGAFTVGMAVAALAALPVGRWLDRRGPWALMTLGSCLGAVLVLAWSRVHGLPGLYVVWTLMGLVLAATLYEPAFGAIVRWFPTDNRDRALTALTLADGHLTRHALGPGEPVTEELEWLRFALVRLTRRSQGAVQRATMLEGARASAQTLGHQLIAPLVDSVDDRPLVIVPTGSLHAMPWAMLPQLRGRPVVVAPSAASWSALQAPRATRPKKVVLAAGPRLRHATAELAAVSALYSRPVTLTGRQATVATVMRALDGATVAHVACHGHFRSDSPLFSSLELADGPLNAYELQRLRCPPELIVLSACDLGTSDARPGDELLGFAAALIGMGTRTIIASVAPVPDAGAKRLMIALHRHLTAGDPPSVALATAQARMSPRGYGQTGFACLGTG